MAELRVMQDDLAGLETKANIAYELFKRAVETEDLDLVSTAQRLYRHDLGTEIERLVEASAHGPYHLNKGGGRARKIEGFIVQYLLMFTPTCSATMSRKVPIEPELDDPTGGLIAFIEAEDSGSTVRGEVFRRLADHAENRVRLHWEDFEQDRALYVGKNRAEFLQGHQKEKIFEGLRKVLNALEYTRSKYSDSP